MGLQIMWLTIVIILGYYGVFRMLSKILAELEKQGRRG